MKGFLMSERSHASTHRVQRKPFQNLVLLLGLQFVDVLVRDEQRSVCAFVESVHLGGRKKKVSASCQKLLKQLVVI